MCLFKKIKMIPSDGFGKIKSPDGSFISLLPGIGEKDRVDII
jgi:hypothetical protein